MTKAQAARKARREKRNTPEAKARRLARLNRLQESACDRFESVKPMDAALIVTERK